MASLFSPQSQAGVLSFYDAPSKGPKINPKFVLVAVIIFALAVILMDHFIYA
ncbi:preprotein translocase subunit Sec61beta [Candidatus Marsarchaeota archaeon]|nr:preprotein translocase subunit Sec61beta [Candidatus Marsarchaeota archaeon]MCL5404573.1 preprotein translocase subunit Sec61beta [Candidatus Marsarchaeota archaeon]